MPALAGFFAGLAGLAAFGGGAAGLTSGAAVCAAAAAVTNNPTVSASAQPRQPDQQCAFAMIRLLLVVVTGSFRIRTSC